MLPGPLTYESGAPPIALCGPALLLSNFIGQWGTRKETFYKIPCLFFSSSPEPKAPGELIGSCPSSSVVDCQHFRTTSPLKPLGRWGPNFICCILGLRD